MIKKVTLQALKDFSTDPANLSTDANMKKQYVTKCFNIMLPRVEDAYNNEIMPFKNMYDEREKELLSKYCKGMFVMPMPKQPAAVQYYYEPIENAWECEKSISELHQKRNKEFAELMKKEVEIDVELCPRNKLPNPKLFDNEANKVYVGICVSDSVIEVV